VNGADVDTVLINGKVVMKNRKLLTLHEDEIMATVEETAIRIKKQFGIN
jgi:5-methylthioadenosine/S-adenosylhomocysteine deaminase